MSVTADRLASLVTNLERKEDAVGVLLREGGHEAFLDTLSERPDIPLADALAIASYRLDLGLGGEWLDLLCEHRGEVAGCRSVDELAGTIPHDAPFVELGRGRLYAEEVVQNLRPHRSWRPLDASASVPAFVRATEGIDLEHLSPAADYVVCRRYRLDPSPAPSLPDLVRSPSELLEYCRLLSAELEETVGVIDRHLSLAERRARADRARAAHAARPRQDVPRGPASAARDPDAIPSTADTLESLDKAASGGVKPGGITGGITAV